MTYEQALETLTAMFPTIRLPIIEATLQQCRGVMEVTVQELLVVQEQQEISESISRSGGRLPAAPQPPPRPRQAQ